LPMSGFAYRVAGGRKRGGGDVMKLLRGAAKRKTSRLKDNPGKTLFAV